MSHASDPTFARFDTDVKYIGTFRIAVKTTNVNGTCAAFFFVSAEPGCLP